ncbi:MAG: glycoside hydrolase family 16 protein [Anaerolineae bacterium]|nr:glycoside hydrolase family 16 protein [Anaerolineae bacterium]
MMKPDRHSLYHFRPTLVLLLWLLAACGALTPAPTPTPEPTPTPPPTPTPEWMKAGWTLVWQDEFDGTEIDSTYWTHETGGNGWGNAEWEYYTNLPTNSFIEDGKLVIQALKEDYGGRPYTSARLITRDKLEVEYGRVEARIQLPFGQGIWPAFWMLGNNIFRKAWPTAGEIDIMEYIGREPNTVYGTVHGPGYSGGNGIGDSINLGKPVADDFHVFAIEWEPEEIRWYVDEVLYHTVTPTDLPDGATWVFDHPFYLLLNVAVGGRWPGYPDDTTTFPQQMLVDYVRVYAPAE